MGRAGSGTLEVLWPGGIRNRLYDLRAGERVVVPEIPCGFDRPWESCGAYRACVVRALDALVAAKALAVDQKERFLASALRAFDEID